MSTRMEFGSCLDSLLSILGISINRLSKVINVDSSLVNRWVNGKRIPAYNSTYIENISTFLAQNTKNSLQIQLIDEVYENFHDKTDKLVCVEEKIKTILFESQGYSLELQKSKKNEGNPFPMKKKATHYETSSNESTNYLASQETIICGTHNIIAACNELFDLAITSRIKDKKIYITYFNDVTIDGLSDFQKSLLKVMQNGWEIHFLVKFNPNSDRTIKLINFTKPLISTGKLFVYFINHYDMFPVVKDYILVSGFCAVNCFVIHSKVNCIFSRTPAILELYEEYLANFLACYSQPLFKVYAKAEATDYNSWLAESEYFIGKRIMYKDCFCSICFPSHLYMKLLKKIKHDPVEIARAFNSYQKRLEAFEHNIITYEHCDIYRLDSINHLIQHQQIYLYDHTGVHRVHLDVEEIIELFENIIHLLEQYQNYHIAFLVEQANQPLLKNKLYYCMVKEKKTVAIEIFNPPESQPEIRLSIDEPMLVYAFELYFRRLWEQMAPLQKSKHETSRFLQHEIELLRKKSTDFPFCDS